MATAPAIIAPCRTVMRASCCPKAVRARKPLAVRSVREPTVELATGSGTCSWLDGSNPNSGLNGLIEISAPGTTKGAGLARLAAELGIPPAEVIAVGDMPNDLSMLRWAGHGVAMANAHPTVLEAADEITGGNSEDGLAAILEKWF